MFSRKTVPRAALALLVALAVFFTPGMSSMAAVSDNQIVVDGHTTGYAPTSIEPNDTGGYILEGPISSGLHSLIDTAAQSGEVTSSDNLVIDKTATPLDADNETTIKLSVDAKPATFSYQPPPTLDYVFVVDVTSSMLQPLRDASSASMSRWQMMWDERTRIYKTRQAVKNAAADIWASNPDSTITIIPFGNDAFVPQDTGGFTYGGNTSLYNLDSGTVADPAPSTVHMPTNGVVVGDYTNLAANQALTSQYNYKLQTKPASMDTFYNSIDALPLVSNTNTPAGMQAALALTTSGSWTETDPLNRIVCLVTDGGANVPIGGMSGSPAAYYEKAQQDVLDLSNQIKDPAQGNAGVNVISIDPVPIVFNSAGLMVLGGNDGTVASYDADGNIVWHRPQEPGETVLDVEAYMKQWATSPTHYYSSSTEAVEDIIGGAVRDSIALFAGFKATLHDALNTNVFEMVSVQPDVAITIDGVTYRPGDPGYPLDPSAITFGTDGVTVDFSSLPAGALLNSLSSTQFEISYTARVKADLGAHRSLLHTNIDEKSYFEVVPPAHRTPEISAISYDVDPFYMPFPTPVLRLDSDSVKPLLYVDKVDEDGNMLDGAEFVVSTPGKSDYHFTPAGHDAAEMVLDPGATYTVKEAKSPDGFKALDGDIVITVDDHGTPTLADGSPKLAALEDLGLVQDHEEARLTVTNVKVTDDGGGGGGTDTTSTPTGGSKTPAKTPASLKSATPLTGDSDVPMVLFGIMASALGVAVVTYLTMRRQSNQA